MGAVKRVKNVEWEKNRRDKLNLTFLELSKLLPDHDPALVMTKVEILNKSIAYIKELQDKNSQLVGAKCSNTIKTEMETFKQKINELKLRNRQLIELLRAAENSKPHSTVPFTPPRKWAGKITQLPKDKEHTVLPFKKEDKPDKTPIVSSARNKPPTKIKNKTKKQTKSKILGKHLGQKVKVAHTPLREINNGVVESSKKTLNKVVPTTQKSVTDSDRKLSSLASASTTGTTPPSIVLSQPCTNIVTVAKSNILAAPIMATGIQPVLQRNPGLSTLGPGTLILPDGRVVPVPAAPTVLATATQIIVNRPASQPAVILMQNLAPVKTLPRNQTRPIVPKIKKSDTTKTTFVNKVPIPAISTHTIRNSITSSKAASAKDSKRSSEKKKTTVNKETIKKKTVVNEKSKELDKSVGLQSSKGDKIIETERSEQTHLNSVSEQNCQHGVSDKGKVLEKCNENSMSLKEVNQTEVDSDSNKRNLPFEDNNNENVKRLKITEISNSDKNNSIPPPLIPVSCCNNSTMSENSQNSESTQQIENHERYSINSLCTQETVKSSNLNSSRETHNVSKSGTEITSNPTVSTPLQEVIGVSNNLNNAQVEKDNEGNKENNPNQTSEVPKFDNSVEIEKKMSKIPEKNSGQYKKMTNDNKTTEQNVCTVSIENNNLNEVVTTEVNCTENEKNISESTRVQNFEENNVGIKKNVNDSVVKNNHENKLIIQDDSQELSSLFPTDPKLQSCPDNIFRDADFRERNLFVPISHSYMDEVRLSLPHSDFSNDLFSSLQVPTGSQHPESISPTAAFLLAFPLVSTSKTSELIAEAEANESQHATPTTILQIGNIDPPSTDPYHQTLMIEGNGLQNPIKMTKPDDSVKSNPITKQQKSVNHFEKFQQIEMSDLLRNENFTRNSYGKDKKSFSELQEQDMYMPCNKKKANTRSCDYPVSSEAIHYHNKSYEYSSSNLKHNSMQDASVGQARHTGNNGSQKKIGVHPENLMDSQNLYNLSSQPYHYASGFSNGNDFPLSSTNYSTSNRLINDSSKSSQVSSNFNTITWSTPSVTTSTNRNDYAISYCSNPQKPFTNPPNKCVSQKVHHNNYEDQMMKEKSTSTNNTLPKFSTNFQFNNNANINNSHSSQDNHGYTHANHTENNNFKLDSKSKKAKSNSQRPPVNWMTTPVVRPVLPDSNITASLPDTFQPQKDIDFNSSASNVLLSSANNIAPFNIPSSVSNNSQTFYSNSHFTGIDFQLDFAPFPEMNSSSKTSRTMSNNQQNPHHLSWSPSKSSVPLLPHLETNMIPSTLPTLVGDLALGTSTPSGPVDAFRTLSMPSTPFNMENMSKKGDIKQDMQKQINGKSPDKDNFTNSERRHSVRINMPDYCQKTHSHQSTNTTPSFLSVSQLVDHVKSEQGPSRRGGKQSISNKNSVSLQKRNHNTHPADKSNQSKTSNNINISNSFPPSNTVQPGLINQKKQDIHSGYQNNQNLGVGYSGGYGTQIGAPPWQQNKNQRSSANYKGNYSAESLIGDHSAAPTHEHVVELPPFTVANQFSSQYNHTPVISATGYSGPDISHQNIQPLEFHQTPHQNCFNFSSQNTHYSASFNPENDFHLGLDPLYSFNPSNSRNISCQTATHGKDRSSHKRMQGSKRREEFTTTQFMQTAQNYPRGKSSLPSTSSPNQPGTTTTLTNFNLSTIFPEINDKRAVPGSNTFHASGNKHSDSLGSRPNNRIDYTASNFNPNMAQMQQVGLTTSVPPHFPPVTFPNIGPPAPTNNNFRPQ